MTSSTIHIIEQTPDGRDLTAEEFFQLIRRSNKRWWEGNPPSNNWIFRGQWNGDWPLYPTAWRSDQNPLNTMIAYYRAQIVECESSITKERADCFSWCRAEYEALRQFCFFADELGMLNLPTWVRNEPQLKMSINKAPEEAAVAQHYGLPTRLLDWTDAPLHAAYFACGGRYRTGPKPTHMSVFALNTSRLSSYNNEWDSQTTGDGPRIRVERFSRSTNPFSLAQKGLFTQLENANSFFLRRGRWPSLQEIVPSVNIPEFPPVLLEIRLPIEEADSLLMLLDREGINEAHLMPTLDRAVSVLKDRWAQMN